MKKLFVSFIILLSMSSFAYAQVPPLPDVYIKDFSFSKCDQKTIDNVMSSYGYKGELIKISDDGSYFDLKINMTNHPPIPTPIIMRVLCYTYVVGNKGIAEVNTDGSLGGDNELWQYFTITNPENWPTQQRFDHGGTVSKTLNPGETYTNSSYTRVSLNSNQNNHCIGMKLILNGISESKVSIQPPAINEAAELDVTNNTALLCFEVKEYSFPGTPQNLRATSASDKSLGLTWDKVADADTYEITAVDYSPNKGGIAAYFVGIKDNKTTIQMPDNDFYCLWVKAGVGGTFSDKLCYGATIHLFDDVSVTSWYFPYLQELQANGIIDGYKNAKGQETGKFGSADTLTVSQALKMAFTAFWWVKVDVANISLPSNLQNHWAAEYLKKGYANNLTILKNLDTFKPDRPITRAEVVQMFSEVRKFTIPEYTTYTANDIAGSKYANLIQYAYEKRLISGYPDGTFKPNALLNRAEIVKIISEFRRFP